MKQLISKSLLAGLLAAFCLAPAFAAERVRIATEGAYPPFNMKNASGELIGFDVDIARALCDAMQADCEIVSQDWDGIIPGLLARKYDAIIASMSITEERKRQVAFTDRYYSNYLRFVAPKGSTLDITNDGLRGRNLGAQRATIAAQYLEDNLRRSANIKVYDTQEAAYLDMKSGRLDALLSDVYPAHDWLSKPENDGFDFIGKEIDIDDKIGIAVRKGDRDLRESFNRALQQIRDDGTYQRINQRYFPFSIY